MLSKKQRNSVLSWVDGEVPPRPLRLVIHNDLSARTHWHTFICLYPGDKEHRLEFFTQFTPGGTVGDVGAAWGKVRDAQLPQEAVRLYRRGMRNFPAVHPGDEAWKLGVEQARKLKLPLAVFAVGHTERLKQERQVLYLNALLPPSMLLVIFKQVVRER